MTKRTWLFALTLSAALGVTLLVSACGSMSKDTMETKLAALGKNQPLVERGLRRLPIVCDLGAGPVDLELVHSFVPATAPRPGAAPVVLVHGTPGTLFNWTEVILGVGSFPGLAADRDVYALEMLGHGLTIIGTIAAALFVLAVPLLWEAIRALMSSHAPPVCPSSTGR